MLEHFEWKLRINYICAHATYAREKQTLSVFNEKKKCLRRNRDAKMGSRSGIESVKSPALRHKWKRRASFLS